MKTMMDRRLVYLTFTLDDLMVILRRAGCLDNLYRNDERIELPDDARVIGAEISSGILAGSDRVSIALESDMLGEQFKFRGRAANLRIYLPD